VIEFNLHLGADRRFGKTHSGLHITSATLTGNPSLAEIDRRYRHGMQLDLIDWRTLVDRTQSGAENRRHTQYQLLPVSIAVFEMRVGDLNDPYLEYYLGNLPYELRGFNNCKLTGKTLSDKVRQCSALALQVSPDDPIAKTWSMCPARSLSAMLAVERFESARGLNAAMRPHWDALWSAAQLPIWTWMEGPCGQSVSPNR
jgi:phage tail protein X